MLKPRLQNSTPPATNSPTSGSVPDKSQLWLGSLWAVPEAFPGPSSNYLSIQICIFFLITIFCNFTPPATNSPTTGSVPDRSQLWLGSLWPFPEAFPGPSSNYLSIPIYLDSQKGFHIPPSPHIFPIYSLHIPNIPLTYPLYTLNIPLILHTPSWGIHSIKGGTVGVG